MISKARKDLLHIEPEYLRQINEPSIIKYKQSQQTKEGKKLCNLL